jgi:histidinol dehydrogenase
VATKYPRLAEQYFSARGVQVELVRLDGSIELAPLVGLAERIVDLVQSGETLRANGLVEVAEIARSTARLIVNRAAMKTEYAAITELIARLRQSHTPSRTAHPRPEPAARARCEATRSSIGPPAPRAGRAGPATIMKTLDARTLGVDAVIRAVDRPPSEVAPDVTRAVDQIIADVRARGDAALLEYTARFDGFGPAAAAGLAIPRADFEAADQNVEGAVRSALAYAAERIERYHAAALPKSWRLTDEHGSVLGQDVRPLERVGIYIPGGRAAYPSTVLMTAVPARVAGVREIVLVTPPGRDGSVPAAVLAAARIAGVTEGWRIGGAQAIAALAYGTPTIRRVDKIVGPGNIYVALAKSKVFGDVGIDMVAGPSEVVVVADRHADPALIAADLLAQAEHVPMARSLLITDAAELLPRVQAALDAQLTRLSRRAIAEESLGANGRSSSSPTSRRRWTWPTAWLPSTWS